MPDDRTHSSRATVSFEEKIELLSYLLDREDIQQRRFLGISPRNSSLPCPLSFAQERLWFLDQLEPSNPVYNLTRVERLVGALDFEALKLSLAEIVRRHEVLRTRFVSKDGSPVQVIAEDGGVPGMSQGGALPDRLTSLSLVDLSALAESERESEALRLAVDHARQPFDLTCGPLLRVLLIRLADNAYLWLLSVHQIVFDWRSHELFSTELATLYRSLIQKTVHSLPALPVQYADFAAWQRDPLMETLLQPQLSYWKRRLEAPLPLLELPTDHPRPAVQSFRGARQAVVISEALTERIKDLSRREQVTLFVTLMAAFKLLLYRYSGQEDLIVGFPVANRNYSEIENLIGFFVNTLVLRTDLSGDPTFRELLGRVHAEAAGALANQDLPFEILVEELRLPRDLSRNPLFQVMFILQDRPLARLELPGLASTPIEIDTETAKFDLTLTLTQGEHGLTGFFEYSTDLFDRPTIERMVGHFRTLLEGIVADPDQTVASVDLLTQSERHELLVRWNETAAEYSKDACIHELIEAQAEKSPEAIAVESGDQGLSYRELNSRANQLARYLRALGVGPNELVGICIERSLEMVIGLLGILKAGGVYVPLDPTYPRERLAFMAEDSKMSVLLTDKRLAESGPLSASSPGAYDSALKIVCLDKDWETIGQQSEKDLETGTGAESLAYVIYTSGSAGRPKGVEVSHRSVVNCLDFMRRELAMNEREVWLAVTTISFDIAALELYLPLIAGGKVVLASREKASDGAQLLNRLANCRATVMQATPSSWRLLLEAGWEGSERLKILCGGEALSRELAEELWMRGGSVWNLYGPTESTIWSTICRVESGEGPVPIGRPIANTQIYILDARLQPVPIGVPGELFIAGDGLARGYLNQPEWTAEKFIPNLFGIKPGSRLYKTGDRARYLEDGKIEFLGRLDHQLKIRGCRVEPGEIETVLDQHPAVRESVVVAREEVEEREKLKMGKRLVAYIVPGAERPRVSELYRFVREKLPEYMVPSVFVTLEALPLTPNGKIDRSALPPPGETRPQLKDAFVEPRTEIEELVAQVWREVLRVERLGMHDNFFELGGHSLVATRVISRIRDTFGIEMPLRRIFETPTVSGLAQGVEEALRMGRKIERAPIVPVPRQGPILPSIAQEPLLFLDRLLPGTHFFNIPAAYRWKGPLDAAAFERSLNAVAQRHEALRTTFPTVDGQRVQLIAPSLTVNLEVSDLRELAESEREAETLKLARAEAERPFDLVKGPLFRVKVLRLADTDHVLLITMHHIISDAWSMVVFLRDLAAAYGDSINGRPPSLSEMPIQFADFAHWQRKAVEEEWMKSQLAYWEKQLAGPLLPLEFSTGRRRVDGLSFATARKSVALEGELYGSLKKLSQVEKSTLFMTLLAALKILLYGYTGQEDIRVGTLVANRNRSDTEKLVGHFVNTLVIRTQLTAESTFRQFQRQVRDTTLSAHAHQDLPFDVLLRTLEDKTALKRASLFQVMFIYQNAPLHGIDIPGVTVDFWDESRSTGEPEITMTTFDLILLLKERPGRLVGSLIYKIDLFDEATIDQIVGDFHKILEQMVSEPEKSVAELCAWRPIQG